MPRNLREALAGQLTDEELRQLRAFDIIGDIAVVKLTETLLPKKTPIGQALLQVHSNLRTVLNQSSPVKGEFRTRELELIAGEPKTETTYLEAGCSFKVDLAKTYFSPRLSTERLRVARLVQPGEVVVNMFAGVGTYSVVIAKHSAARAIYSVDKNPSALVYMRDNIRINKVGDRVVALLGDAREITEGQLAGKADRVLMPLPEVARDFFDAALSALKESGGVVHFYDVGQEPDLYGPSFEFAKAAAAETGFKAELSDARKIRSYATRCYHVVLDLSIHR